MMVKMIFTTCSGLGRMLRLAILAVVALCAAAPAAAQVIEVNESGVPVVRAGATVTTLDKVAPIVVASPGSFRIGSASRVPNVPQPITPEGALEDLFTATAHDFGVDRRLLHAVAWHESRYRQDVISDKGAVGVMQLMPATARSLGVDSADLVQNVRGGAALLARLLHQFGGDVRLTLAAYNAGPASVLHYGGVPPFRETQTYVAQIMQHLGSGQ